MVVRIIDSSLLIEAYHQGALDKLEDNLKSGNKAVAPPKVYDETVREPERMTWLASSARRIKMLYTNGAITIEVPDYTDPKVSDVVDKVKSCVARKSGKPAHMVELADLQIVALAVSHVKKDGRVEVVFRDKALRDCLARTLHGQGISGVSIVDVDELIQSL